MDRPAIYGQEQIEEALLQVLGNKKLLKIFYEALEIYEEITCYSCGNYDPKGSCHCWNDE